MIRSTRVPLSVSFSTLAIALSAALALPLTAAAEEGGDRLLALEEVVVTAQKRGEERLIDVPISISVLSEESIRNMGLQNLGDIAYVVPGLSSFESVGTPGQQKITMRGIGADSGQRSTVGYYWDEMPANSLGSSPDGTTLDVNRVEVLRGPQGTLFGEGSMGGTIRIISNKPDLTAFGGEFEVGAGTIKDGGDSWNGKVILNVPVVENVFGLRVAGEVRDDAGFIDNLQLGKKDFNDRKLKQLRVKGLWQMTDSASLDFTYYHYANDIGAPTLVDDLDALTVNTFREVTAYSDLDAYNAVLDIDLGFANLISSTTYVDHLQNQPAASGDGITSLTYTAVDTGGTDFNQEIRLTSMDDGPLRWTVGGFYTETKPQSNPFIEVIAVLPGLGPLLGFPPGSDYKVHLVAEIESQAKLESWAAFGELSYDITERLTGTVGLRYYESQYDWVNTDKRVTTTSILLGGVTLFESPTVTDVLNRSRGSDDSISPKFNLSYAFSDDAMAYVNVAKGFRAGGVNLLRDVPTPTGGIVQLPESYGPESLWTYELGAKAFLADGSWMVEGAVFYTDWTDLQSVFFPFEGATVGGTANRGNATIKGAELAMVFLPTDTVSLGLNIGYTDAEFDDPAVDHQAGDPIPFVPELSFSASADWRPELSGGYAGLVHFDYSHQDEVYRTSGSALAPLLSSDSFQFLNARIGVEKDQWGAYLFGRNLANEQGMANPVNRASIGAIVPVRPRVLGVEFRMTF